MLAPNRMASRFWLKGKKSPFNQGLNWVFLTIILALLFTSGLLAQTQSEQGPDVAVVAPFAHDEVSGTALVLIKPEVPAAIERVTVRVVEPENPARPLVEESVSPENWSAEIDSTVLPNGEYALQIESCGGVGCSEVVVPVVVENPMAPQLPEQISPDPPPQVPSGPPLLPQVPTGPELVSVTSSNWLNAFYLIDSVTKQTIATSSGDPLRVPAGIYDARLEFLDAPVQRAQFFGLNLSQDAVVLSFEKNSLSVPFESAGERWIPVESVGVQTGTAFASGELWVSKTPFFWCSDFAPSGCRADWKRFDSAGGPAAVSLSAARSALVWADPAPVVEPQKPLLTPQSPEIPEISPMPPKQEPPIEPELPPFSPLVWVTPSDHTALLRLFDEQNRLVATGTQPLQVPIGRYSAELEIANSVVSRVVFNELRIDSNGTLLRWQDLNAWEGADMPAPGFNWSTVVGLQAGFSFESAIATLAPVRRPDAVWTCAEWVFEAQTCIGSFERMVTLDSPPGHGGLLEIALQESPMAIGLSVSPKSVQLTKTRAAFAANDVPKLEVVLSNAAGENVDWPLEAFLVLPDQSTQPIAQANIQKAGVGRFVVEVARPRSFKPGTYSLKVRVPAGIALHSDSFVRGQIVWLDPPDGNHGGGNPVPPDGNFVEESESFEWGLIALNTRKSIYRPLETAEFEIVVLDANSFGVPGARVSLTITTPDGLLEVLSTENGTILETTVTGVYLARLPVVTEGTYHLQAHALADQIDTVIKTTFDVLLVYDFDIVRKTNTKIDPARQPIPVQLSIAPFYSESRLVRVREFVPKEFEIQVDPDDSRVLVFETDSEKIIEWNNVELNLETQAVLNYSYSVPDKKPWLYLLGPIEITPLDLPYETDSFWEARSWMVAVDANPATIFYFRKVGDLNAQEPMPNAQATSDTYLQTSSWVARAMNDVAGTSSETVSNASFTSTSNGAVALTSFISPPLVPQTVLGAAWTIAGWWAESGTNDDLNFRTAIHVWDTNDAQAGFILDPIGHGTEFTTSTVHYRIQASGSSFTFARGQKIVAEAYMFGISPSSASGTLSYGGNSGATRDSNLIAPQSIRFAGDLNTTIVSPARDSTQGINTAFDVNAQGVCANYVCGDTNVILQYCVLGGVNPGQCGAFSDMNTVATSPLYVSSGDAFRRDWVGDGMGAGDTNYFVFAVTGTQVGTYTIRSKIDSNWSDDINYSNQTDSDINVTITTVPILHVTNVDQNKTVSTHRPLLKANYTQNNLTSCGFTYYENNRVRAYGTVVPDGNACTFQTFFLRPGTTGFWDINATNAAGTSDNNRTFAFTYQSYWDVNADYNRTTTFYDFNYSREDSNRSLTLHGGLDWNSNTENQDISDANLVAWIDFDDANATHVRDKTRYENDFNITNGATTLPLGILGSKAGIGDGSDNFFGKPFSGTRLNFSVGSWGLWSKSDVNSYAGGGQLFERTNTALANTVLRITGTGLACIIRLDGSESTQNLVYNNSDRNMDMNWHHYFCTYDGSTLKMYIDGNQQYQTLSVSGTIDADSPNGFAIGANNGGTNGFNGKFDDARIFDRALSAADVNRIFLDGALDRNQLSLLAYYKFDETDRNATHIQDYSVYNHDLSINNSADINGSGVYDSNAAMLWDNDDYFQLPTRVSDMNFGSTQSFSYGGWIKVTSLTDGLFYSISQGKTLNSNGDESGWSIRKINTSHKLQCQVRNQTGDVTNANSGVGEDGLWHHVFCVVDRSNNQLRAYADGNLNIIADITGAGSFDNNNGTKFEIGSSLANKSLVGRVDEVKVYKKALSEDEILRDYNAGWSAHYYSKIFGSLDYGYSSGSWDRLDVNADINATNSQLRLQARTCNDSLCDTETFVGSDGTSSTYFNYSANGAIDTTVLGSNPFFQFKTFVDFNNDRNLDMLKLPRVFRTDVNVIAAAANDYTFVLLLPSTGCTQGKGSIDAGVTCDKGYFEATDLSGVADENQVNPEGQSASVPFFVYDNQSTSSSDLNILLDLNQSLPTSLILKVSKIFAGWAYSCTGNTDSNCLLVSTTATNIGKATYSTGTQDLNIFVWADFNAADVGQVDRNVDSNSIAP